MNNLNETITRAKEIMIANKMEFVTIWKTGKSYGFNFENKKVGYSVKENGIKRIVIAVIN